MSKILKKLNNVSLGTIVQSRYGAHFYGKIIKIIRIKNRLPLWVVQSICTVDGRPYRKGFTKTYSATQFEIASLPERAIMETENEAK